MPRVFMLLSLLALLLWSCGPDTHRSCSGADPAFKVVLKLTARPLPLDTVVLVAYAGSGMEEFRLSEPDAKHSVTFCKKADEKGVPLLDPAPLQSGAAGADGAAGAAPASDDPAPVASLYCELYTAGYTELKVSGSGFPPVTFDLAPKERECTVTEDLPLDSLDAG